MTLIYADEAACGGQIDRVDIGAKMMTKHTSRRFGAQDEFGGELLGLVQPPPDGGLGYAEVRGHFLLRAEMVSHHRERFEAGGRCCHTRLYIHQRIMVKRIMRDALYELV